MLVVRVRPAFFNSAGETPNHNAEFSKRSPPSADDAWVNLLTNLFRPDSVSGALVLLSLACALGLAIGAISIRGVKLGVAGVLFAGMLFGALGARIEPTTLAFLRDFGMTLFVYALGLQVGPGFLASLRRGGLKLNLLATTTLVGGAIFTIAMVLILRVERTSAPGLFVAGFTTTPGLVAAQQRFRGGEGASDAVSISPEHKRGAELSGVIYAMGYPFGCVAPIAVILILRKLFRIRVDDERKALEADSGTKLLAISLDMTNADLHNLALSEIAALRESGIVVGKVLRGETLSVPTADTRLQLGDVLLVVGPEEKLLRARTLFGPDSKHDLRTLRGAIQSDRLLVTNHAVLGKRLRQLEFPRRFGVTITRVLRSGIELTPGANLAMSFGDTVVAVGPPEGLKQLEQEVGNSMRTLNHPQLVPVFIGIALGVLLGMIPIKLPGLSDGIKLGVAVGPLVIAIVLSRIGHVGRLIWHMPNSANFMFREFGLAIFLACVGLSAGKPFMQSFQSGQGLTWIALAAVVSIVPMLIVAIFARAVLKMNFITLCGLISGAMTNSPSLAYATDITRSDDAAVVYATVYPLSMVLPVVMAQLLAVWSG
jgi:putative transport protein